jgi:hypothetical protein
MTSADWVKELKFVWRLEERPLGIERLASRLTVALKLL